MASWRRKATDVLLAVSAIVLLPVVVTGFLGFGIQASWVIKLSGLVAYLTILGGALARHVDYRLRVWVSVGVGYLFTLLGSAAFPEAPFLRALPFEHAICVLVLTGEKQGRIATLISIGVLFLVPVLHVTPGMTPLLTGQDPSPHMPLGLMLVQSINMTGLLIGLMVLLDRFHAMLLQTLTARQQATEALKQEAEERAAAHRELEREMAERRRLERELAQIADEERRRLGQDVHDGVCQQLTGALLRCQALERRLTRDEALPAADLNALSALLEEAIDEAHAVAQGLHPLGPEPGALAKALRTLARRTQRAAGLNCRFVAAGNTEVPDPALTQHLYRIAQEAVSNAMRHAGATQIIITLAGNNGELLLQVDDNGRGLSEAKSSGGMGMRTMAARAQVMNGAFTLEPSTDGGLRVVCRVPCSRETTPSTIMQ